MKKAGPIVLFRFPYTDLLGGKRRPAILLAKLPSSYDDWLVCMLSSQTHQSVSGIDELISPSDRDFKQSNLKKETVIRLTRLAVASDSIFTGILGEISPERVAQLKSKLARWIEEI